MMPFLGASAQQWQWAQRTGGDGNDEGFAVAIHSDGHAYVTGAFEGTGSFGSFSLVSAGQADAFISRHDEGGDVVWARSIGGPRRDNGWGVAVDETGVYVVGYFEQSVSIGSWTLTAARSQSAFLVKLTHDGDVLWARSDGGDELGRATGVTTDNDGNVYVVGYFAGTANFDGTELVSAGNLDMYVAKYSIEGRVIYDWLDLSVVIVSSMRRSDVRLRLSSQVTTRDAIRVGRNISSSRPTVSRRT
jgi:hypothetical protein